MENAATTKMICRAAALILISLVVLSVAARNAGATTIHVTSTLQKVAGQGTGGCSLEEAIYSSVLHDTLDGSHGIAIDSTNPDHFLTTDCELGTGTDTIELPTKGEFAFTSAAQADAYNHYGPTATPLIFATNLTIEGNGSKLIWGGNSPGVRLFAVGSPSLLNGQFGIPTPNGVASGTGSLTINNVYIKGFVAKGGNGAAGGGGGLGAGGAIFIEGSIQGDGNGGFVAVGSLLVENSTFDSNGAVGGNGTINTPFVGPGGGGGGMGGNGGIPSYTTVDNYYGAGGGGGGSRGNGGNAVLDRGGAGGGTLHDAITLNGYGHGGYRCGGDGGDVGNDGAGPSCPGGGGGGGGQSGVQTVLGVPATISGGGAAGGIDGAGGGGGGVSDSQSASNFQDSPLFLGSDGGNGGYGGGGGGCGGHGILLNNNGGNGGFGGGGGACTGNPGHGGTFGGDAGKAGGGGGAGLGGAIFGSYAASIVIHNSTFTGNYTTYGTSPDCTGCYGGTGGDNAGGAIFSQVGPLAIDSSTISGNESTGSGSAVVVYYPSGGGNTYLNITNSIIANNGPSTGADGPNECYYTGSVIATGRGNLIVNNGSGTQPYGACVGVVSMEDPQLGLLADNGGRTPTMAIPQSSPAFNAADAQTSLPTDQRGEPRPQLGGYDIGAFEACTGDFSLSPLSPLTVQLDSSASTTVTVNSANCFFDQQVNLSASGQPTGVTTSFNPTAVTPPAEGSANSSLTVTLGPSFTPHSFSFYVTGIAGGPISHTITLAVTPVVTAASVVNVINQDQALGCIDNSGIGQSLIAKLNAFQMLSGGGHLLGAVNVLAAFQLEVQAETGTHIAATCTDNSGTQFSTPQTLIADAQFLQKAVGASAVGDPIVGSVVNSSGLSIGGATVNLLSSSKIIIGSTTTDAVGFYYFGDISGLTPGVNYTVKVPIPQGYKSSTPSVQTFTWSSSLVNLRTFALN